MDKIKRDVRSKSISKASKKSSRDEILVGNVTKTTDHHVVTCLDDWTRNNLCPLIYVKAAILFQHLEKSKDVKHVIGPVFFNEFERKKAYGIAFATKRHTAVLKEVLKDSAFSRTYAELLALHEPTVLVMLMDLYGNKFNEKHVRKKCDLNKQHYSSHIDEIANTLYKNKIKLSAAFARQRIEFCAPSLDELLPEEEQKQWRQASHHPVYVRINTLLIERKEALDMLSSSGFTFLDKTASNLDQPGKYYCTDEDYDELLVFPNHLKDEIYGISICHQLIPQSKNRYIVGELVRNSLTDLSVRHEASQALSELLSNTKLDATPDMDHILLTHPEAGTLSSHICSFLDKNKRLLICGGNSRAGEEMEHMLKKVGATNYAFLSENFSDISPSNEVLSFCKVVICNPPCSKSAIVNLLDFTLYEGMNAGIPLAKDDVSRKLAELTHVQVATVNHALRMPCVQKVIYCTSSNNIHENEGVIDKVLKKDTVTFEVCPISPDIVPCEADRNRTKGIFLTPSDKMDGFFVTLLKRKKVVIHHKVHNIMKKKKGYVTIENKKGKTKKKKAKASTTTHKISKKHGLKKSTSRKGAPVLKLQTKSSARRPATKQRISEEPKEIITHNVIPTFVGETMAENVELTNRLKF